MKKNELVSVIMSCYNERIDWLEQSIESILKQTYSNFEFIIISDNPNNTLLNECLTKYCNLDERITIIFNEKNLGLVKSLNRALSICTGEYILRMDADDISKTTRIEYQLDYLISNELDFVLSNVSIIDENGVWIKDVNFPSLNTNQFLQLIKISNFSFHSTWIFRKCIATALEGYREIDYCEDYDFLLRLLTSNYKTSYYPINVLDYRIRKNGISNSNKLIQYLNMKTLSNFYLNNQIYNTEIIQNKIINLKNNCTTKDLEKYSLFFDELNKLKNSLNIYFLFRLIRLIKIVSSSRYSVMYIKDLIYFKTKLLIFKRGII